MFRLTLPFPDSSLLFTPQWSTLDTTLQVSLLALICLVPLGLILWLYRYELKLVTPGTALSLLALRLLTLSLILFLVCLQPVYARERVTELPGRLLVFVDRSESMDVADRQRTPTEKLRLARALRLHAEKCPDEVLDRWIEDHEAQRTPRWLSEEEARQEGPQELEASRKQIHDELCARVDGLTRSEISRLLLEEKGLSLLERLRGRHEVEVLGFHRESWQLGEEEPLSALFTPASSSPAKKDSGEEKPGENKSSEEKPGEDKPGEKGFQVAPDASRYTDLHLPLARSEERAGPGKGKVLGVVVLTDGQHNFGNSPVKKAYELGQEDVPVFPVGIGARKAPEDIAITGVRASSTVFKGVEVPVEVSFRMTGLPEQDVMVELFRTDGEEDLLLEEKRIHHDGKTQDYHHRFQVKLDEVATHTLLARIRPLNAQTRETRSDNNSWPVAVNVADDRAKVLVVDGEARWEFHYLATALERDATMELQRVVYHQPRLNRKLTPEQLRQSGSPDEQLPEGEDTLAEFDCIILGDVSPEQLSFAERVRLEKYVAERGGTLVVLVGKRAMPLKYPEMGADGGTDPLRKLLPVEEMQIEASNDGFGITLTHQGRESHFMQLDSDPVRDQEKWASLPLHYWAVVGKPKPGAMPLAYVHDPQDMRKSEEQAQERSLITLHSYGFGRVLYVGLDSTWRWRYKMGDTLHHRFWGQAIRWAAAEKPLVTGNDYVRFGAPRPIYSRGEAVDLVVRLNQEAGPIRPDMLAAARILRQKADVGQGEEKEEAVALVPLAPRPAQPRVLQGQLRDLPAGRYEIELVIPDLQDKLIDPASLPAAEVAGSEKKPMRARFSVLPSASREMIELQTRWPLLEELAQKSGGQAFAAENVDELAQLLTARSVVEHQRHEQRLWQWWVMLAVVLSLLTLEWVTRKLKGLA